MGLRASFKTKKFYKPFLNEREYYSISKSISLVAGSDYILDTFPNRTLYVKRISVSKGASGGNNQTYTFTDLSGNAAQLKDIDQSSQRERLFNENQELRIKNNLYIQHDESIGATAFIEIVGFLEY